MKKENYNMKTKPVKRCREDVIFDTVIFIILTLILFVVAYPLYWVIISSFSDPTAVSAGKVLLRPMGFTLKGYAEVFKNGQVMRGFFNSIVITFVGVCVNLAVTLPTAYALSRDNFSGKKPITVFYMITMFFGGGMIPTYLVVKNMQLLNTIWALVLPGAISTWNLIIMRTFFMNLPVELEESAQLDGANDLTIFSRIILPLSKASIATITLFYAVSHWNNWFNAMIYFKSSKSYPLQTILRSIVINNEMSEEMQVDEVIDSVSAEGIKYSTLVVSMVPMLVVYPFIQKYFVKGVMIGSLKG